jgi:predicted dehydrogenase
MRAGLGKEWEIAALADPSPVALETYQRNYAAGRARIFRSGPELLAAMGSELGGMIIGSPNALHLESLLPGLELGVPILLEKPVATTVADCRAVCSAYRKAGSPPLAVGFVLRYTAFYRKASELVASGDLGQVLTIEATELMAPPLTAMYMRGWRRHCDLSGPLLLEKCSHDMDILNSLAGVPAVAVSSQAARTHFIPRPDAARHCADCGLRESCRYNAAVIEPYLMNVARRNEIGPLIPSANDLCVYNSDKDIVDHQVVNIRYENGILATFTVCADQPRTTRTLRICGTRGQLVGDIGLSELRVIRHGDHPVEHHPIRHDASGHHGGDSVITRQFVDMLRGRPTPPLAGLREGVDAALLALAADEAAAAGRTVDPRALMNGKQA